MLQTESNVVITDNSGGKFGRIFKIPGGHNRRYARLGDEVIISVKVAEPRKNIKKKDVVRAVVVRQSKPFRRDDGSYIRFDDNAVVIIEGKGKSAKEPRATRVFGPIPRELVERGYQKIASLAPEVV